MVAGDGLALPAALLEQLDRPEEQRPRGAPVARADATVEQRDEDYALVDPLFAEWIAGLREPGDEA